MQLVHHPLVCGQNKRSGLFWFTISAMLADSPAEAQSGRILPRYLDRPETIFDAIWALPDGTEISSWSLHALSDRENASTSKTLRADA
jgi:hypothetical protein